MSETLYVGQSIRIVIACTIDGAAMNTAMSAVINYLKPDGTEGSWPAVIDNGAGTVSFNAARRLIDRQGPGYCSRSLRSPGIWPSRARACR